MENPNPPIEPAPGMTELPPIEKTEDYVPRIKAEVIKGEEPDG